jgi:hypothetical protein
MRRTIDFLLVAAVGATVVLALLHLGEVADAQRRRTREAIEEAATHARVGTPEFFRLFRAGVARRLGAPPPPPSPQDADPRFLKNLALEIGESMDQFVMLEATKDTNNDFPEAVAVLDNSKQPTCSAVLLDADRALTMNHCTGIKGIVPAPQVSVNSTIIDTTRSPPFTIDNNAELALTILFLKKSVTGAATRPLATTSDIDNARKGTAVGYGLMSVNNRASPGTRASALFIVLSNSCSGTAQSGNPDASEFECVQGADLVAKADIQNQGTCNGDSGGPLLMPRSDGSLGLAALIRGPIKKQAGCGQTSIFVRLDRADVREWIDKTVIPVR